MREDKNFYIVDKSVLPEIFLKVMDVKNLLESGKEKIDIRLCNCQPGWRAVVLYAV